MSFFTDHELALATPSGCGSCGLYNQCRSPRMPVSGKGRAGIMLLDSFPHEKEDCSGCHLVSPRADFLAEVLHNLGYDIEEDCWRMSAVGCRVPHDKAPSEDNICACRSYVLQTVNKLKPRLIICLGEVASATITAHSFSPLKRGIDTVRGFTTPDQTIGTWVGFAFGIDYVNKTSFDPAVKAVWLHDIRAILDHLDMPFPKYSHKGCVEITTNTDRICSFLHKINMRKPVIAFDYETTGLKPHARGHKILSVAVAVSATKALSFPIDNPNVFLSWQEVLTDPQVVKVAHNAPFELLWSDAFVAPVEGTVWDTCLLAHMDDCRRGVCGLDTQAYLRFGIQPWDTVEQMKNSTNKALGANAFNRLHQVEREELLTYNGIDALYTWWLFDYFRTQGMIPC